MKAKHPGMITFVDATAGTEKSEPSENVSESIAFVQINGVNVAVVKVVATTHGDHRTIHAYGADGVLLKTTVQLRQFELGD